VPPSDLIRNERGRLLLRRAEAYQRAGDEAAAFTDRAAARQYLPAERQGF
jgi:hypothetical protein